MDELQRTSRADNSTIRLVLPTVLIVIGSVSIFTIDSTVGRHFQTIKLHGEIRDFIDAAEHFGTPYGQILSLLCVAGAAGWQDRRGVRIFVGATIAGLCANLGKLCVARIRPRHFDFETHDILESFVEWFPLGSGGSNFQSFPSAHTASAFGFAALLTWAYPKGRSVYLILALLVGLHRVTTSAHYPSDVFIGGAIGWSAAWVCTGHTKLSRVFNRFERSQPSE